MKASTRKQLFFTGHITLQVLKKYHLLFFCYICVNLCLGYSLQTHHCAIFLSLLSFLWILPQTEKQQQKTTLCHSRGSGEVEGSLAARVHLSTLFSILFSLCWPCGGIHSVPVAGWAAAVPAAHGALEAQGKSWELPPFAQQRAQGPVALARWDTTGANDPKPSLRLWGYKRSGGFLCSGSLPSSTSSSCYSVVAPWFKDWWRGSWTVRQESFLNRPPASSLLQQITQDYGVPNPTGLYNALCSRKNFLIIKTRLLACMNH